MSKSHIIELSITNKTGKVLEYADDWFQTGRLADGQSWPRTLSPDATANVRCYESDWSPVGCSGWVKYMLGGQAMYLCFSNPSAGSNGIDFGSETGTWNAMQGHYFPVTRSVPISGNLWATALMYGSGGTTNKATWVIQMCDVGNVTPANLELRDVKKTHASLSVTGTRRYYECDNAPTMINGLVKSHFKGIASFAEKLIFTHTNLFGIAEQNGRYLIADKITNGSQGAVEGTFDTAPAGLLHPCSSQACGSFMAMGIQADESGPGSEKSEIQILDIRMAQVNRPVRLLGSIQRPDDGVNGVAMTREPGPDGRYLVAAVNGHKLKVYRSAGASLMAADGAPTIDFTEILYEPNFPDSGAGLALVTQQGDGAIFLFALNARDDGSGNEMNLYALDLQSSPTTWKEVLKRDMQIPGMSDSVTLLKEYAPPGVAILIEQFGQKYLNSSFRWGKGLAIKSEDSIEVYASDRNTLSLSHIPMVGSVKDFSVVVWSSAQPGGQPLYLTTQGSDGIWIFDLATGQAPAPVAGTGGLGFRAAAGVGNRLYLTTHGPDGIWTFDVNAAARPVQLPATAGFGFRSVTGIGDTLYLTTQGPDGIWTYNVVAGGAPGPVASTAGLGFNGVTALGNILYLTTQGSDGIWTFDATSGSRPKQIETTAGLGFTGVVAVRGILYLTTHGSDGIWTFDPAKGARPVQIGSTAGLGFRGVVALGNMLYLTTQGADGIWRFDTGSAAAPAQMDRTAGLGFMGVLSY